MNEAIENEINSDSKLGQELKKYKENNTEPPKVIFYFIFIIIIIIV